MPSLSVEVTNLHSTMFYLTIVSLVATKVIVYPWVLWLRLNGPALDVVLSPNLDIGLPQWLRLLAVSPPLVIADLLPALLPYLYTTYILMLVGGVAWLHSRALNITFEKLYLVFLIPCLVVDGRPIVAALGVLLYFHWVLSQTCTRPKWLVTKSIICLSMMAMSTGVVVAATAGGALSYLWTARKRTLSTTTILLSTHLLIFMFPAYSAVSKNFHYFGGILNSDLVVNALEHGNIKKIQPALEALAKVSSMPQEASTKETATRLTLTAAKQIASNVLAIGGTLLFVVTAFTSWTPIPDRPAGYSYLAPFVAVGYFGGIVHFSIIYIVVTQFLKCIANEQKGNKLK